MSEWLQGEEVTGISGDFECGSAEIESLEEIRIHRNQQRANNFPVRFDPLTKPRLNGDKACMDCGEYENLILRDVYMFQGEHRDIPAKLCSECEALYTEQFHSQFWLAKRYCSTCDRKFSFPKKLNRIAVGDSRNRFLCSDCNSFVPESELK